MVNTQSITAALPILAFLREILYFFFISTSKHIITSHSLHWSSRNVNFTQILPFSSQQSITGGGGNINLIATGLLTEKVVPLFQITSLGF